MTTQMMSPDEAAAAFWNEGYMAVEGFLPEAMATLAARYALMQYQVRPNPERPKNGLPAQVEGAHSVYGDPLAESLLDLATADVGRMVGRRLLPTYAFYRVYRPGDSLTPHTDRISCEISASLCLGYRLDPDSPSWPLGFRTRDSTPFNLELEQRPGDLVIYQGCECIHWRRQLAGGPETWHAQVFLHWVDADGPYSDICEFDCRPQLGMPEDRRDPERVRVMNGVNEQRNIEKRERLRNDYLALSRALGDAFQFVEEHDIAANSDRSDG